MRVDFEEDMVTYRFHLKQVGDIDNTRFNVLFKSEGKVYVECTIDDEAVDHVKKVWFYADDSFKFFTTLVVVLLRCRLTFIGLN